MVLSGLDGLELDDAAQHVAALHLGKRILHVVDTDALGDELAEREAALQVQVDVGGEVALREAVAVPGGLCLLYTSDAADDAPRV